LYNALHNSYIVYKTLHNVTLYTSYKFKFTSTLN